MRIILEQAGGFAAPAMNRRVEIDTSTLDAGESQAAAAHARTALASNEPRPSSPPRPDAMSYRLTIQDGDQKRVLTFSDADLPAAVAPLLAWMQARR